MLTAGENEAGGMVVGLVATKTMLEPAQDGDDDGGAARVAAAAAAVDIVVVAVVVVAALAYTVQCNVVPGIRGDVDAIGHAGVARVHALDLHVHSAQETTRVPSCPTATTTTTLLNWVALSKVHTILRIPSRADQNVHLLEQTPSASLPPPCPLLRNGPSLVSVGVGTLQRRTGPPRNAGAVLEDDQRIPVHWTHSSWS